MQIRQLFRSDENRAVSPVIGVILMVAITVILAAVIGTFVLGLGDQVQQTTPTTQISGDQSTATVWEGADGDDENQTASLTVTHDGGDRLVANNIDVTVDGHSAYEVDVLEPADDPTSLQPIWASGEEIRAGSSATIVAYNDTEGDLNDVEDIVTEDEGSYLSSGNTVRVIWTSDDGSTSATLFERDVN